MSNKKFDKFYSSSEVQSLTENQQILLSASHHEVQQHSSALCSRSLLHCRWVEKGSLLDVACSSRSQQILQQF